MKKKEKYLQNWNDFNQLILPELKKKYKVSQHSWMFKIKTENTTYNYYPKGERLEVQSQQVHNSFSEWFYENQKPKWYDMTLKDFEEKFISLTVQ